MRRALLASGLLCLAALAATWGQAAPPASGPDAHSWRAAGVQRAARPVTAPPLVLQDLGGKRVDLRQFRERIVLVYFWGSW